MAFEYKCVAAPERAKRRKGARGRTERVAKAMEEIISAEAIEGWEYQRTDLIPIEEKSGLFSRPQEVHRAVLVFRRALAQSLEMHHEPRPAPRTVIPSPTEPEIDEEPIRLAAERDERPQTVPAAGSSRPPTGLG